MQIGFTPDKGTIDGEFIWRRLQGHHTKGKSCIHLEGPEKAHDRVQ